MFLLFCLYIEVKQCFFFSCSAVGQLLDYASTEAKFAGLEESEGTETFTRMLNDVFDALNTKLPSRGIRRNSKEIQASSSTTFQGA